MYKTVTIDVDVDVTLNDFDDDDLVEELKSRGYKVNIEELSPDEADLDKFDLDYLINLVDADNQSWYTRRVRDKLFQMRY